MQKSRDRQALRWVSVVAWMGLIFTLSAQSTLPDLTRGRPDLQDIVGHFTVYAILALLGRWALRGSGVRHATLWALALTVLYGVSDEYHQSFVPGRYPDPFDLATDAVGAAVALGLAHITLNSHPRPPRSARQPPG